MNGNASLVTSSSPNTAPITSRDRGPTTGNVAQCSVTEGRRPAAAAIRSAATPASSPGFSRRCRWWCDQVAVLGDPDDGAVVDDHAVGSAHHAVADEPDLQAAHQVGVERSRNSPGVRALHVDLAECGAVENADTWRGGVGILDSSTLGKIDVQGGDAGELLDLHVHQSDEQVEGRHCPYGVMCGVDGMVIDDGTVMRLGRGPVHRLHHHRWRGENP